jgi:hypothetical protein
VIDPRNAMILSGRRIGIRRGLSVGVRDSRDASAHPLERVREFANRRLIALDASSGSYTRDEATPFTLPFRKSGDGFAAGPIGFD